MTCSAREWTTVLGETTLSRCKIGVVAKIDKVFDISARRISLLSLSVEEVIWGARKKRLVNVIVPETSKSTGMAPGHRLVAFLEPMQSHHRVINMFYLGVKQGPEKLELLREHLALERLPPARRAAAHRAMILAGLVAGSDFRFYNTMGELGKRVRDTRGLLDQDFRRRLNRLAFTLKKPKRQLHLRRLLLSLPVAARGRRPAARDQQISAGDDAQATRLVTARDAIDQLRRARTSDQRAVALMTLAQFPGVASERLLISALGVGVEVERRAAAFALGEIGRSGSDKALLRALLAEEDGPAARQQIRALGLMRSADAVPQLGKRLNELETVQEALLALARVRNRESLAIIGRFASESRGEAPYPALRRLAAYYLSNSFETQDRVFRR